MGADVRAWYNEMPKALRADAPMDPLLISPRKAHRVAELANRLKIDEHFLTMQCLLCGKEAVGGKSSK